MKEQIIKKSLPEPDEIRMKARELDEKDFAQWMYELQKGNASHSVFMKKLLWLDDIRNPFLNLEGKVPRDEKGERYNINWVLNYEQFTQWIEMFGLPDAISFDHDLADEHYTPEYFWDNYEESKKYQDWKSKHYQEKTGMDCAKWLVYYCLDNEKQLPKIYIHSANPVGADNIKGLLDNFASIVVIG